MPTSRSIVPSLKAIFAVLLVVLVCLLPSSRNPERIYDQIYEENDTRYEFIEQNEISFSKPTFFRGEEIATNTTEIPWLPQQIIFSPLYNCVGKIYLIVVIYHIYNEKETKASFQSLIGTAEDFFNNFILKSGVDYWLDCSLVHDECLNPSLPHDREGCVITKVEKKIVFPSAVNVFEMNGWTPGSNCGAVIIDGFGSANKTLVNSCVLLFGRVKVLPFERLLDLGELGNYHVLIVNSHGSETALSNSNGSVTIMYYDITTQEAKRWDRVILSACSSTKNDHFAKVFRAGNITGLDRISIGILNLLVFYAIGTEGSFNRPIRTLEIQIHRNKSA